MQKYYKKELVFPALAFLVFGGLVFSGLHSNNQPLFENTDNFVLFAKEEIKIEQDTQVSSGDIGSNGEIDIQKEVIVNGNLFADEIEIDKNTIINGNALFNKLKTKKDTQILGEQIKPVQLPIANLLEIPDFQTGEQNLTFEGEENTLAQGNYNNIVLEKDSRLTLTGGTYNLNKLNLKQSSTLIFNLPTTINIQEELKTQQKTSIFPGQNLKPDDLIINYKGKKEKHKKNNKDDDKENKNSKPIEFGKQSFLNFKLLAPQAQVHLDEQSTLRGQIIANKIKIEKDSILSREEVFEKESDPEKIIINTDGSIFPVNEVIINFNNMATFSDAQNIAAAIDGRVIGFIEFANAYRIEVVANNTEELDLKIKSIENLNSPLVEGVFENFILKLE